MWLRAFVATELGDQQIAPTLLDEGRQLARILGAIVVRSKSRT